MAKHHRRHCTKTDDTRIYRHVPILKNLKTSSNDEEEREATRERSNKDERRGFEWTVHHRKIALLETRTNNSLEKSKNSKILPHSWSERENHLSFENARTDPTGSYFAILPTTRLQITACCKNTAYLTFLMGHTREGEHINLFFIKNMQWFFLCFLLHTPRIVHDIACSRCTDATRRTHSFQ